jgi:hypothetical protein
MKRPPESPHKPLSREDEKAALLARMIQLSDRPVPKVRPTPRVVAMRKALRKMLSDM